MNASVNLRGDLAKLNDSELGERLNAAWQAVDAARAGKRRSWLWPKLQPGFGLAYPWRGPFRHPRFYRFLAIWSYGDGGPLEAIAAAVFSGRQYERFFRKDPGTNEYLSLAKYVISWMKSSAAWRPEADENDDTNSRFRHGRV